MTLDAAIRPLTAMGHARHALLLYLVLGSGPISDRALGQALPPAFWQEDTSSYRTTVGLTSAPFPHSSGPWSDRSVLIVVPKGIGESPDVGMVVHFHGFWANLARTVPRQHLVEEFVASGAGAVLVIPQGPVGAASGNFGKLMEPGGLDRLLHDVLALALRDGVLPVPNPRIGDVVLTAHSGGYRAVARILPTTRLSIAAVHLFDALYGEGTVFANYARGGGRLRSNFTDSGGTRSRNLTLASELSAATRFDDDVLRATSVVIGRSPFSHDSSIWEERHYARWLVASGLPPHRRAAPEIESALWDGGMALVRWQGDDARRFLVEGSSDGISWRTLARGPGSSATVTGLPFLRVRRDDGDPRSEPSRAYGATGGGWLIVDGFDRYLGGSRSSPRHDLAARLGSALGRGFSVASNEAVAEGRVSLANFARVLWFLGDESRMDLTFDSREKHGIESYLAAGGKLVASGSEIGYATDADWLANALHARYVADSAGTSRVAEFRMGVVYPEDSPDVLAGQSVLLRYSTGSAAAVGWAKRVIVVGFALETLADADRKAALDRLATWLDG